MPASRFSRLVAPTTLGLCALALTGCTGVTSIFGNPPYESIQLAATPAPTTASLDFNSVFSDMGSIHPTTSLGRQLDLELDLWTEQKTHEWRAGSQKLFSFVINVYDRSVSADAAFATKRLVYLSNITITVTTATADGSVDTPLALTVDPIAATLDPEALRSAYGLLITSPKGGFQLESNQIGALADTTTGITLDFAMTISSEAFSGSGSYSTQIVHQLIPVAIYPQV